LRFTAGMMVRIHLNVLHTTLRGVGFCLPGSIQHLHATDLLQRQAPPVSSPNLRVQSALAVSSILITEHLLVASAAAAQDVGTQEPRGTIIDHGDRLPLSYGGTDQAVNLFW
jgi:hypothetical protein